MNILNNNKGAKSDRVSTGRLLLPSLLGIIVCVVSLLGVTWAWFTASASAPAAKTHAATYTLAVSTTYYSADWESQRTTTFDPNDNGGLSGQLPPATHTVTISANGTAATGYCEVKIGDENYYVKELKPKQNITFTVINSSPYEIWIDVIPHWGTYKAPSDNPPIEITNGCTVTVTDTATDSEDNETEAATTPPETSEDIPETTPIQDNTEPDNTNESSSPDTPEAPEANEAPAENTPPANVGGDDEKAPPAEYNVPSETEVTGETISAE